MSRLTVRMLSYTAVGLTFAAMTLVDPAKADPVMTLDQILGANSAYNAVIFGNIGSASAAYTSDSQGSIAAGGNAYFTSFNANANGPNGNNPALVVGGNLNFSNGQVNGNTYVGGVANFTGGTNVTGTLTVGGSVASAPSNRPTTVSSAQSPVNFSSVAASAKAYATAISQQASLAQMAGTAGTVTGTNNLVLTGTQAGINYFNITAQQLSQLASGSLTIKNLVAGATDIINVTGTNITVGAPGNFGFFYTGITDSHVLFNFADATQLKIANAFDASILAPNADVSFTNGNLTGTLIANNLLSTQFQNGEFHYSPFQGSLSGISPAPLPLLGASPLAGFLLAGATGLMARRRRTRS